MIKKIGMILILWTLSSFSMNNNLPFEINDIVSCSARRIMGRERMQLNVRTHSDKFIRHYELSDRFLTPSLSPSGQHISREQLKAIKARCIYIREREALFKRMIQAAHIPGKTEISE